MPLQSRTPFFLALVLITAIIGFAQAPPTADSYVTTALPSSNFGASPILPVQAGTTSYVQLNLASFPANAKVAKATLRLYVDAVTAPGSFDVFAVSSIWSERGLTAGNAPALGTSATAGQAVNVTKASVNQFVLVDITSLVQGWLDGSIPNHGVALALTSAQGSFAFDSKESGGHGPELEIALGAAAASPLLVQPASAPSANTRQAPGLQAPDVYIDNGTALQAQANFNIDGNGTAATLNAVTTYQLNGAPLLSVSGYLSQSLGLYAGQANTGNLNTFAGFFAGSGNTTGAFNTVVGAQANNANQTGNYNTIVGAWAGLNNTGTNNAFYGAYAGYSNTAGVNNMFFGTNAGNKNTTGNGNFFLGAGSGYNNTTGNNNTFLGYLSGQNADATASNNLYVGSQGAPGESGAIRIGDPASQTATYIAGVSGAPTSSGVPVFVDSTGKLGTAGGSVTFTQVTGTLTSPQFAGTYGNSVTLSNSTNVFAGSFAGNGSGLIGVNSGLAWPVVKKSADYSIQISDFSTPSTVGAFLILTSTVSHTFTLPNPPPANGSCVAVGNAADAGINSGTNVFLTVSPNGVNMDSTSPTNSVTPTMPRHTSYLYCSDGTNYFRLGYQQNGVSEIGPWIKTVDTGVLNAMQSTFRNGMDFGLADGSMILLQPKFANTSGIVTLNLNGLGSFKVLKYGLQALTLGDLTPNTFAVLIYNANGMYWELVNPQTSIGTVTSVGTTLPLVSSGGSAPVVSCPTCVTAPLLTGVTGSVGGSVLSAGDCATANAAVTGATVGHPVSVSASDGSLPNGFIILSAAVTAPNTVTVQLCATATVTPAANTYNVATQ